jgi:hypothetical protein
VVLGAFVMILIFVEFLVFLGSVLLQCILNMLKFLKMRPRTLFIAVNRVRVNES